MAILALAMLIIWQELPYHQHVKQGNREESTQEPNPSLQQSIQVEPNVGLDLECSRCR